MFDSVEQVREALAGQGYIPDERLATTVFLLTRLDKPLLVEGPAGVGKTELAKALAAATGRRLLRLQCYEGQDETKALYEWDYGKQLLYTQILREKIGQIVADASSLKEAVERIGAQESVFFSERFLAPRPLLEAVRSPEPVVLLVDEIDRADEALEAVLLELLGEFQVSVPEIGTFSATHPPYVVLTSNNTRELRPRRSAGACTFSSTIRRRSASWRSCVPRRPALRRSSPSNSSASCVACASWICAKRRASRRRSTGRGHCRARGARAIRPGVLRHGLGGGEVRQGRPQSA